MTSPKTSDALLSAPEVRDLIDRALEVLEGVSLGDLYDGDEGESESANRRLSIGMEGMRFALRNAEALSDPRLLDAVLCALDINEDLLFDSEGALAETFPEVLTSLLSRLRTADTQVDPLVTHARREVRAAVAEGLRPRTRWARAHLETLAHDLWPTVRVPAQRALQSRKAIPKWWGLFDRDPFEGRSPKEVAAIQERIEAMQPYLDTHDYQLCQNAANGKLANQLRGLPPELAAETAEKVVRDDLPSFTKPAGLFDLALRGPDRRGFLNRWLTDHQDSEDYYVPLADQLEQELAALPLEHRDGLFQHLIDGLRGTPKGPFAHAGFRARAARLLGNAWPVVVDPSPVIDLILEQPDEGEEGRVCSDLGSAIRRSESLSDALLERVLTAQQEGWPGRWSEIRAYVEPHLEKLPRAHLRAVAEKAIHHADDQVATWGLRQLLTHLHEKKVDGARAPLAARYWADSRWRRLLIPRDAALVMPLLRADLREEKLTLAQAVTAMHQIGTFYGGVGPTPRSPSPEEDAKRAAKFHETMQEPVRDLLGAKALRGPPTEAEWTAFRAIRARELEQALATDPWVASRAVTTAPSGDDWHPEDRAMFWRAIKLVWQTKNDQLTLACLQLMSHKPLREDMLVLEKLHRIDAAGWGAGRHLRSEIRKALGLDLEPEDDEPDEEAPAPTGR